MGLYSQMQIRKLRHEVHEIREEQGRIVEDVAEIKASIGRLGTWLGELSKTAAILPRLDNSVVVAKLRSIYYHIQGAPEVAVHTGQQAQHHRLAMTFSPPINYLICLKISNHLH